MIFRFVVNDEIVKLLAERFLNKEHVSAWAIKCLEKGFDSKSLRMLASMSDRFISPFELDEYFERTVKELGWDKFERNKILLEYTKILAEEIIKEKTDAIEASREIYLIHVNLHYPAELSAWFEIDEMIWEYDSSLKTGKTGGYFYRSKEELITIIRNASRDLMRSKQEKSA